MATIVVLGGGVIGLNTAYRLAQKAPGNVILLDKGPVGDGASSRAAGIITGLLWTETGVLARHRSLNLYRELSEELAVYGYQFQDVGCLNLFDQASWQERKPLLPLYERLNTPYTILSAADMRRRWPHLTPTEDLVGLYDPLGGYSEPHEFVPALAQRCRDLGVDIREGVTVTGFLQQGERVNGVETSAGTIHGDAIVCTVHAWSLAVLACAGLRLPMKSFVHQRYVTTPLTTSIALPAINANPQGGYIRPARLGKGDWRLLAGAETAQRQEHRVERLDFHMASLSVPEQVKHDLKENLSPLVPELHNVPWETEKVGLISFSMDGEPILGTLPRFPGLVIGAAFHSGGFAYSPVAGLLLAQLALGESPSIDIAAFAPDRFTATETETYLVSTVTQAHAVRRRH